MRNSDDGLIWQRHDGLVAQLLLIVYRKNTVCRTGDSVEAKG